MSSYDSLRIYQLEQPRGRGVCQLQLHRGFKPLHVSLSIGGMTQVSILEDTQAPLVLATFVLQVPWETLRPELQGSLFGGFTFVGAVQRPDQTHVFLLERGELAG